MSAAGEPAREVSPALRRLAAMAYVGVLVFLAGLPVVTALAAAGAGAQLLREQALADRDPGLRRFVELLRSALSEPLPLALAAAAAVLGGLDLLAVLGGLPGAWVVGPALALMALAGVVCALRAACAWRPGVPWSVALADGAWTAARDPLGSGLLVGALAAVVVVVSQAVATVVVAPGMLVLAALAVDQRLHSC